MKYSAKQRPIYVLLRDKMDLILTDGTRPTIFFELDRKTGRVISPCIRFEGPHSPEGMHHVCP